MIAAFDRAAVRRIGETDSRLLDLVMPRLSRLANRGLLWIGVASVLRATGDRRQVARRAAWRGLAAASAATNILGKSLTARDRPHDKVPGARQLNRAPRTTSFPSGHAASAAAFATGVALEKPSLAAPSSSPLQSWERRGWSPGSGPRGGHLRCPAAKTSSWR
jgi:undecaprenyl-diphosphatase